jgi:3-oxoacyl-[acyl-carrier protein] reductase
VKCTAHTNREALISQTVATQQGVTRFHTWCDWWQTREVMDRILQGKTAVVTGSTKGIGRAIARAFAAAGANVIVHGTSAETVSAACAEIPGATGCPGDVADPDTAARQVQTAVNQYGGLDIIVCNAGHVTFEPFLEMSRDTWQRFYDVHVTGAFLCGQAAARHMVKSGRGGRIINTSSVAAWNAMYGFAAYSSVKAAIAALTKVEAVELGEYGITANAIAPGPTRNEMMDRLWGAERLNDRAKSLPLGRLGVPDDVASVALFLASPAAAYVTGQVIAIDGGGTAAGFYTHQVYEHANKK